MFPERFVRVTEGGEKHKHYCKRGNVNKKIGDTCTKCSITELVTKIMSGGYIYSFWKYLLSIFRFCASSGFLMSH